MINLANYPNMSEWASRVGEVSRNIDEYKFIYEQPLLDKAPSLDLAVAKIQKILK